MIPGSANTTRADGTRTELTGADVVQGGEHPQHEGGGHGDGVPGLLQHELVPRDDLGRVTSTSETLGCPYFP